MKAFDMIAKDPELGGLFVIEIPPVCKEMRGVAALKIPGDLL